MNQNHTEVSTYLNALKNYSFIQLEDEKGGEEDEPRRSARRPTGKKIFIINFRMASNRTRPERSGSRVSKKRCETRGEEGGEEERARRERDGGREGGGRREGEAAADDDTTRE